MNKYILFDLDGTIIESGPGIMNSVRYALEKLGETVPGEDTLIRFVGPPLRDSFVNIIGLTPENAEKGVWYFREHHEQHGVTDNKLYPNIENLLKSLQEEGFHLYIATSKPEEFAKAILKDRNLSQYFLSTYGSRMDESGPPKPEIMAKALAENKIDPTKAIMVGDRLHDVEAANQNGVSCIGVLYGYGSREELTNAGAAYIAETVADLLPLIRELKGGS